jgi:hypothetical protein
VKGKSDEGEGNVCDEAEASTSGLLGDICNVGMQGAASSSDTDTSGRGKAGRSGSYEGAVSSRGWTRARKVCWGWLKAR